MNEPGRHWDVRYSGEPAVYGTAPNAFFAERLALLEPGRMLLPGDGEGRNAVHAALEGWSVRSFDASSVGVGKSLEAAAAKGVTVEAEVGTCEDWVPDELFDAIGLFYLHLPPDLRPAFHTRACRWLKPGGALILEGFGPGQLAFDSGGPKSLPMLFTTAMLEGDFAGLEVLECRTMEVELDEGPYHQGRAEVTRFAGRKPL